MEHTILVVEDEQGIREAIGIYMKNQGYNVILAANGKEGLEKIETNDIHLAIVDIMMPVMDGISMVMETRKHHDFPILFLSAKSEDIDKITGLNIGADDYITKPFGTSELLARIRTSLRHSNRMASNSPLYIRPYKCQGLILDFEKRMLTLDGEEIHLTPVEYKIVAYLARNSGKVMTYASVMANVWGPFTDNNNRILRVNMANIRRKIERNPSQPQFLFTEVGVGYRMCEDENEV